MKLSIMTYCYSRALAAGTLDLPGMLEHARLVCRRGVDAPACRRMPTAELRARLMTSASPCRCCWRGRGDRPDPARRQAAVMRCARRSTWRWAWGRGRSCSCPAATGAGCRCRGGRWIADGGARACELGARQRRRSSWRTTAARIALRGRVEHMREFCDAHPDLGLCFDDGNFFLAGEDQETALAPARPRRSRSLQGLAAGTGRAGRRGSPRRPPLCGSRHRRGHRTPHGRPPLEGAGLLRLLLGGIRGGGGPGGGHPTRGRQLVAATERVAGQASCPLHRACPWPTRGDRYG